MRSLGKDRSFGLGLAMLASLAAFGAAQNALAASEEDPRDGATWITVLGLDAPESVAWGTQTMQSGAAPPTRAPLDRLNFDALGNEDIGYFEPPKAIDRYGDILYHTNQGAQLPEPSTVLVLAAGACLLARRRRKR